MPFSQPVTEVIKQRFSCRTYREQPIEREKQRQLREFLSSIRAGPLGTPVRFKLVAATEEDSSALRGLGTYGFIRGATGFILGAVAQGERNLEDLGYGMEQAILFATDIGLGTCWLGGTFTRSRFVAKMALRDEESMPAVASVGYIPEQRSFRDRMIRKAAGSAQRIPWEGLFFAGRFGVVLSQEMAGAYATALEMVRLAPSASNKQPWRIVREGKAWHFYVQRTPGYGAGKSGSRRVADLQRVDMGIAMSHFQLTAEQAELTGQWSTDESRTPKPDELTEYTASWIETHAEPS
jgi:hypothetical protein